MPTRTAQVVLALAIFATVGVIMIGPVVGVVNQNTGDTSITNETVTADYNETADLQGYNIDPATETVYGLNDTSGQYEVASEPGDYTLLEDPGELEFNSSSTLIQEGEQVKVSYTYQASDDLTTLVIGFVPLAIGLLIFVVVAQRAGSML